jgi:hypothetical protein
MSWTLLLLAGCPWVAEPALDAVRDPDGDGVLSCGFQSPGDPCDCDDDDGTLGVPQLRYVDGDGDGVGDAPIEVCGDTTGTVEDGGDCDDARADAFPGALERCNDLDDDCDGSVDEAIGLADGAISCFVDGDGDGYGSVHGAAELACGSCPPGTDARQGDCDDGDATRHPDTRWYLDADGDGHGSGELVDVGCYPVGSEPGVVSHDDCDDTDEAVFPGAPGELLGDGIDSDCSGGTDLDADGDGRPDRFAEPDSGAPWPTAELDLLPGCDGTVWPAVQGGGDALAVALASAQAGDIVPIAYDPDGDNVYDPIVVEVPLCIVADDGRVTVASDDPDIAAVTLALPTSHPDPWVLLEHVELDADVGVATVGAPVHLTLSRIEQSDGDWLADVPELAPTTDARTDLHQISLREGQRAVRASGNLVVRDLSVEQMITVGSLIEGPGNLSVDARGVVGSDLAVGRALITVRGRDVSLVDVDVERLIGGLLFADVPQDATARVASVVVRDVAHLDGVIAVTGSGDDKIVGTAVVSDVTIEALGVNRDAVVQFERLVQATLERSVVRTTGTTGVSFEDGAANEVVHSEIIALESSGRGTSQSIALQIHGGEVRQSSLWAATCVEGTDDTTDTLLSDLLLVDCVNVQHTYAGAYTLLPIVNSQCDLVSASAYHTAATADLRFHPRNPVKLPDWQVGFTADSTVVHGAHGGESPWVTELHDADADGIFDTWELAWGGDLDPSADDDGDGLDNYTEFYGKEGSWFTTRPDEADTDGDGIDDGADCHPLDPGRSSGADCEGPDAYVCPSL